jgi:nicotinamide-nucleotide amidase
MSASVDTLDPADGPRPAGAPVETGRPGAPGPAAEPGPAEVPGPVAGPDALGPLRELAARLQDRCVRGRLTFATAESCTGGLVGHAITEIAGSSAYYLGGGVTYADGAKVDLLGVPEAALQAHGAVSAQVAAAMAEGARRRLGADLAVAVTGIAGPEGGSPAKPVGLTYVAVSDASGTDVRRHLWHGDRAANKRLSAEAALRLALERLGERSGA